jgi:hypothetical protein
MQLEMVIRGSNKLKHFSFSQKSNITKTAESEMKRPTEIPRTQVYLCNVSIKFKTLIYRESFKIIFCRNLKPHTPVTQMRGKKFQLTLHV